MGKGVEVIRVCSGQRNEQGGRNIIHMGCRHAAGDKSNSRQEARKGKKGLGLMDA
jgi:hypothetical protein